MRIVHAAVVALGIATPALAQVVTAESPIYPDVPPRAALIQISDPDAAGNVIIAGTSGAVAPDSTVVLINLNTSGEALARAAADGSFSAPFVGPAGAPGDLRLSSAHVTATTPGFLLETSALTPGSGRLFYRYDPRSLGGSFPNLDPESDVVSISVFGSGTGPDGRPGYAARVIVLHGTSMFSTDQAAVISLDAGRR